MDKNRIVIKIFRREFHFGGTKFYAAFCKNNSEYQDHGASEIVAMGYAIADFVKESRKNNVHVIIEFPREIYSIDCLANISATFFYTPISEAEIKVFWDRFCKGLLLKD